MRCLIVLVAAVGTRISVTPLAFRVGHELSEDQVPADTRARAEQLYAIYDRARSERRMF